MLIGYIVVRTGSIQSESSLASLLWLEAYGFGIESLQNEESTDDGNFSWLRYTSVYGFEANYAH